MGKNSLSKLNPELFRALDGMSSEHTYPKGATVFRRGQAAEGIFLVRQGRVRLSLTAKPGLILLEDAGPGVVLGLTEAMSGQHYELDAQTADSTRLGFVPRKDLLEFMRQRRDLCWQVVRALSEDLHRLYRQLQSRSSTFTRSRRPRLPTAPPVQ